MKNFIFISPNFPSNYYKFCRELKNNGFNVLGIGDCPYNELSDDVKNSVREYYWVTNLKNYEEVYRAVAYFTFIYGKIDYIESNNEYWLERDAMLRTAFNVKTGFQQSAVKKIKYKSAMKKYYAKAGIKTARYCLVKTLKGCEKFIETVGYPVIAKPDNGVGANDTYKIKNEQELNSFFETKPEVPYIMEEFIDGEVTTYDAIIDSHGNPIFETGNVTARSLVDVVNNSGDCLFYIVDQISPEIREAGRKTVKAFGVKSRFIHFEFFRLTRDQHIGGKGEIVALEVNMRPAGGIAPDMMNYANSIDVYRVWADMIAYDKTDLTCGEKFYCGFLGRRDGKSYALGDAEIMEKYGDALKSVDRVPDALSPAMGNTAFIVRLKTKKELTDFYACATK